MTPVQQVQAPKQATSVTSERSTEIESSDLLIPSLQRSVAPRAQLSPQNVLYLQRTIGNTAVQRLLGPGSNATTGSTHASTSSHPDVITQAESTIQRKLGVSLDDAKFGREADNFSKQVVRRQVANRVQREQDEYDGAVPEPMESALPYHLREAPKRNIFGNAWNKTKEVGRAGMQWSGAKLSNSATSVGHFVEDSIRDVKQIPQSMHHSRRRASAFNQWKQTEPWAERSKRPEDLPDSLHQDFQGSDEYSNEQASFDYPATLRNEERRRRYDRNKHKRTGPTDKDINEMNRAKKRHAKGELRDVRKARRIGKIHNMKRGAFEHVPHHQGISQIAQSPQAKQYGLSKFVPDFVKVGKFNLDGFDQAEEEAQGQMQESEEQYDSGESMVNF